MREPKQQAVLAENGSWQKTDALQSFMVGFDEGSAIFNH
jgi:hypothetical protein